ncbi:MAG: hypothetical protein QM757_09480 [Paludibaculum sp.]
MRPTIMAIFALGLALQAQDFTRGVGIYPGDPKQDFGAVLRPASGPARNLALRRPAYHSSSYDYNLTAQLVTDGIKDTRVPRWISVSTSQQGILKKNEREWLLDGNWVSGVTLRGKEAWIQFEIGGDDRAGDQSARDQHPTGGARRTGELELPRSGSEDGRTWKDLGQTSQMSRPTGRNPAFRPVPAAGQGPLL